MKKTIAIFDVDKTMFPGYTIIDFAEYLKDNNHFKKEEWMEFERCISEYKKGVLSYNEFAILIVDSYAKGIVNQTVNNIDKLSKKFWEKRIDNVYGYVRPLFERLNKLNAEIIIVSGSTRESLNPMLDFFEVKKYYCTEVDLDGDVYGSTPRINAASHEGKTKIIKEIFEKIDPNNLVYGFGDSVADLSFLELVTKPFVIGNHDKELAEVALREGWRVVIDPNQERIEI